MKLALQFIKKNVFKEHVIQCKIQSYWVLTPGFVFSPVNTYWTCWGVYFLGYGNAAVQLASIVIDLNVKQSENFNFCENQRFENLGKVFKTIFDF